VTTLFSILARVEHLASDLFCMISALAFSRGIAALARARAILHHHIITSSSVLQCLRRRIYNRKVSTRFVSIQYRFKPSHKMKGNEALDALVALCDVERVDGGSEENGTKVVRQALSSSQATGTVTDRHSASSNSHLNSTLLAHNFPGLSSSQTSTLGHSLPLNYAPYIQFLQSQMMNAQHLNPIQSASMAPIMDNIGLPLFLPKVNGKSKKGCFFRIMVDSEI